MAADKGWGRGPGRGQRLFVRRIASIIELGTGRTVGAQVEWNTGERRLIWHGEKVTPYRLEPCAEVHDWPQVTRKHCRSDDVSGAT